MMLKLTNSFFDTPEKRKSLAMLIVLALINVTLLLSGLLLSAIWPVLLTSCLLAYIFGLKHALDADHLAAIDNVTRKLMSDGQKPVSVGLFFSLGHSTVVFLMTIVVTLAVNVVQNNMEYAEEVGAVLGTSISAFFLFFVGFLNLFVFIRLLRKWIANRSRVQPEKMVISINTIENNEESISKDVKFTNDPINPIERESNIEMSETETQSTNTSSQSEKSIEINLSNIEIVNQEEEKKESIGFMLRCCPKILNAIDAPWKMYPIGFLFGLGFDTATEVALLAMAATAPSEGVPFWAVLILPSLFTAGMAILDTADGIFMMLAYNWAFVDPDRKLHYNLFITFLSLMVAFVIGGLEVLSVVADLFNFEGPFWDFVSSMSFGILGVAIILIFLVSFLVSYLLHKFQKKTSGTYHVQSDVK